MAFWNTIAQTISSWLKPKTTYNVSQPYMPSTQKKPTTGMNWTPYTPSYTPSVYKPSTPVTNWYRQQPTGLNQSTGRVGGITATAQKAQPIAALLGSFNLGGAAKPAQLKPGVWERAYNYALENPLKPTAAYWARTLPQGPGSEAVRTQLRTGALKQQLKAQTAGLQGYQSFFQPAGESITKRPYETVQSFEESLQKRFPDVYGPGGKELPGQEQAGTEEYWKKQGEVFGGSEAGKSLFSTIGNWITGASKQPGQAQPGSQPGVTPQPQGAGLVYNFPSFAQQKQATAPEGIPQAPGTRLPTPEEMRTAQWQPTMKSAKYEEVTPTAGEKYWWQGGTLEGPPTPEQFNTPEYVEGYFNVLTNPEQQPNYFTNGKLNPTGEKALDAAWDDITGDAKDGFLTPDKIGSNPQIHELMNQEMLMRDKYDPKWVETMQDRSLSKVMTQVSSLDATKLPPSIAPERLDAVKEPLDMATLWDLGYRAPKVAQGVNDTIKQVQTALTDAGVGTQLQYNPKDFDTLTYANVIGLEQYLSQMSQAEWQKIIDGGATISLKTEFWKFNAKGEPVNRGTWDINYPPQSKMTQSERERYIDQQQFYNEWYWSQEATEQRQKEREESWEYYHEKDLEGWKEYYSILDSSKMLPDAYEYFSESGRFTELHRKWETSGSGLSWDQWLAGYDFEGEWFKKSPQERGERPYIFNPRMQRLNY